MQIKTVTAIARFFLPFDQLRRWLFVAIWIGLAVFTTPAADLTNDLLTLRLAVTAEGVPAIKEVLWRVSGRAAFRDTGTPAGLNAWVPEALLPTTPTPAPEWIIKTGDTFITAEATRELANKISMTWVIDLPKRGSLFRLRVRLTNRGQLPQDVEWVPAWAANWDLGEPALWMRWWQALDYDRTEEALKPEQTIQLYSQAQSSDDADAGVNPYWIVGGKMNRLYLGLSWCGGWRAVFKGLKKGFNFSAYLPPEESYLVLKAGETIDGPALLVMPATERDDTEARAQWMQNREKLGRQLFGGPQPTFPLTYNTWYAVRRSVSEEFLKRQIAALSPYGFTNFVVDAGWFEKGKWEANQRKFPTNSLPTIFAALKARGIKPGLWTAPQYVTANSTELPIEQPPIQNKLLDDYLVDLSSPKFPPYLTEHVKRLRQQYAVDYWKYDQAFFDQRTAARKMKIVLGFQEALSRVRRANPDLFIENCSGGGRMLNEFTLLATQTSWLRDLARQSQPDPQANIQVALNALDFVFPWAALRFTVYMDKVGEDDEMTRLDCRSAMAGSWGFSTDLAAISERQRRVILQEIEHYRRLNRLKFACLYDLYLPTDQSDIAGVTYYDDKRQQAAILLYRWQRQGAFNRHVTLTKLNPRLRYRVVDVDRQTETPMRGAVLQSEGMNVVFSRERQSALIFIEPL